MTVLRLAELVEAGFDKLSQRKSYINEGVIFMNTITYAQVQELVTQIPVVKLPIAYQLLTELASHRVDKSSPQLEFILLSLDSQRHLLEQQAAELAAHYEQTAEERNEWQSGDFIDD